MNIGWLKIIDPVSGGLTGFLFSSQDVCLASECASGIGEPCQSFTVLLIFDEPEF